VVGLGGRTCTDNSSQVWFGSKSSNNSYSPTSDFSQSPRLADTFKQLNVNVHDFTMKLPVQVHKDIHGFGGGPWNQAWKQFFIENPGATSTDVFRHAGELFHRFNLDKYAGPIIPYGRS
jgi:uncharacterized lipoprotein (TIGR02269 family)